MTAILLLHSARGLRKVERAAADRLRAAGHRVAMPDLYEGAVTESLEEGLDIEERLWPETLNRASRAAADLPDDAVLMGLSMGAFLAALLWSERPRTAGLLLLHGLGEVPEAPRPGTPVQAHVAEPDPFVAEDEIAVWREAAHRTDVDAAVFRYPGAGHLFTDPALADHDAVATTLLWQRATGFLERLVPSERTPA